MQSGGLERHAREDLDETVRAGCGASREDCNFKGSEAGRAGRACRGLTGSSSPPEGQLALT